MDRSACLSSRQTHNSHTPLTLMHIDYATAFPPFVRPDCRSVSCRKRGTRFVNWRLLRVSSASHFHLLAWVTDIESISSLNGPGFLSPRSTPIPLT